MRLSAHRDDPGYDESALGAEVWLNGELVSHCYTADEEAGIVWCYAWDENGKLMLDPADPERLAEFELRGRVEIRLKS